MKQIKMNLDFGREAEEICRILRRHNYECYIVGGAVRDKLLGKEPHDIDFATNATPDEIERVFQEEGCKTYPTGKQYGTITVTCDGEHFFEITTYRGEKYIRGTRKPIVTWAESIEEDLSRRDFTINAMAYDPIEKVLIDPFGGYEDLKKGVIRAVGRPEERFKEDPLRIFRMCRFASTLHFNIDERTFEGAKRVVDELSWIPKERMTEEFKKAFTKSDKPSLFVNCLVETGAMKYYIPEIYDTIGVEQPPPHMETVYEHLLLTTDNIKTRDYELRMAGLLHDIGKPKVKRKEKPYFPKHEEVSAKMAEKILERTRHSRRAIDKVVKLIKTHMILWHRKPKDDLQARRTLRSLAKEKLPKDLLDEYLELVEADAKATLGLSEKEFDEIMKSIELVRKWRNIPADRKELAITGSDLVEMGVEPRCIGKILEKLVDYVVDDPTRNTREVLLRKARVLAKSIGCLKK